MTFSLESFNDNLLTLTGVSGTYMLGDPERGFFKPYAPDAPLLDLLIRTTTIITAPIAA